MYNDELEYVLESAYEDGYYQALADMGYEFDDDDEAMEDVELDVFDEDYFDESMEGAARDYRRAQNAGKTRGEIQASRRDKDMRNAHSFNPNDYDYSKSLYGMYTTKEGRKAIREVNSKYNPGPKTSNMPKKYEDFRSRYNISHRELLNPGMADSNRNVSGKDDSARRERLNMLRRGLHSKETYVKRMNPNGNVKFEKK